ncbi:MAG: hypothetical protein GX629_01040 [Phycisphaerae bacterium]|nr:hypothetical protein [Phycisphaerae bacterium]
MLGSLVGKFFNGILLAPSAVPGGAGISEEFTLPECVRSDQRESFFGEEENRLGDVTGS